MPEPRWATASTDDEWGPQKHRDILGNERKSKTFYTGPDMAFVTMKIHAKRRMIIDALTEAHANHYERPVYEENPETGEKIQVGWEPEVLDEQQIIKKYDGARLWDDISKDFDERMNSTEGFSTKAATHMDDDERRQRQQESSTGSERRVSGEGGKQNTRMQ